MSDSQAGIWQGLTNILADPAVVSAVGSFLVLLVTTLSKSFRRWVTQKLNAYKKNKKIHEMEGHAIPRGYMERGIKIVNKLKELREAVDCSRVAILQFRNGSMFTLSEPMFRVYGSYESLRNGISPSNNYFKELLATNLIELLAPLLSDNIPIPGTSVVEGLCYKDEECPNKNNCPKIVKYDVDNLPYCTFRFMLEEAGIRTMYATLIKSGDNPIGILVAHYLVKFDAAKLIAPKIGEVCAATHYIQNLLDVRHHNA